MLNCIAIDDEPLALELIEEYCEKVSFLCLQKTFSKTSEATRYLRKFPIDLLFLDIQMPDISGIDLYKGTSQDAMVIFTTAFSEYAIEGFNLNAVDYLLKPFKFDRFLQAVQKAEDYQKYLLGSSGNNNHLFVRSEYNLLKIPFSDIHYIETFGDFLKIYTSDKKPVITLMTLKAMEAKLPSNEFLRVHRSYIIALNKIQSVRSKTIQLANTDIPVGTTYREIFQKRYLL